MSESPQSDPHTLQDAAPPRPHETGGGSPEHSDQDAFETLDPKLQNVWRIGAVIQAFVVGGMAGGAEAVLRSASELLDWAPPGVLTALLLLVCLPFFVMFAGWSFERWSFLLREHDLVARFGVFFRVRRCVPRLRVQHVDINSGPILRAFGLVELSVYTAGTITAVITIPGLRPERAAELRDALLKTEREHA